MRAAGKAHTQIFAETLIAGGFSGLLVPSFARGAGEDDVNLVLWKWSNRPPSKITLIDDNGRLDRI
jgi:RES domain-containing protein